MAILRNSEIKNMSEKDREAKVSDLKLELVKANVSANKANSKTKEIKRAIARLRTFNKSATEALKNK